MQNVLGLCLWMRYIRRRYEFNVPIRDREGHLWEEYDFMDQTHNWNKSSKASDDNNRISRYVPVLSIRDFSICSIVNGVFPLNYLMIIVILKQTLMLGAAVDIQSFEHSAIGDMRIKATYTGLSPDMSIRS